MRFLRAVRRLAVLTAAWSFITLVAWPALAQAQTVSVVPADTTVVAGEQITVRVATSASTDLHAYHLIYGYDRTKLQFVSATVGELTSGHNPQTFLVPDISPADSVIYDVAMLGSSVSGAGILAYLKFNVIATGSGAITPLKVDFRNSLNVQFLPATNGATVHGNDALAVALTSGGLTAVTCFGGSTGAIDITPTGGVGAYTYLWSNGATSQDIPGLAAGTYSVTVKDADLRVATGSWTVTQPTALIASAVQGTAIACFGGATTVTVSATGGTPTYTGTGTFAVSAGAYSYTVTDANGCTSTVSGTISQPAALVASALEGAAILCNGGTTTVTVSATGGTAPFSGTGAFTVHAGPYSYSVTDAKGCASTVSGTISQPAALVASALEGAAILCNGGTTTVAVSATGGTPAYTGTGTFTVHAGAYSYTVTDANGCTSTISGNISQPAALVASALEGAAILCNGGTTTVTVSATGGTAPFSGTGTFTVHAGAYSYTVTDANSCTSTISGNISQPAALVASAVEGTIGCFGGTTTVTVSATGGTPTYTGAGTFTVHAGAYSYTVTDANGCASTVSGNITQPTALVASAVAGTIGCYGGTTTVAVSATGGTPAYTGTETFTVHAGAYSYTVTDANGCTSTVSGSISQPTALVASALEGAAILCNGGTTTVTVSATGGTPTYTGTGTFTAHAGAYSYTVTDANGCTSIVSGSISQPTALVATALEGAAILCNGGTTTVTVSATGGTPTYTGAGTFTVHAGAYSYTVTDANGCTSIVSGNITQPTALVASAVVGTIGCNGATTTVTVSATGGTPTYTGTGTFTVSAGAYSYTVTDANGCTSTVSGNITQPTALVASAVAGTIGCFGGTTMVTVSATGGTPTYTGTGTFTVSAGAYSYTVTDASGCTSTVSGSISQPTALVASAVAGTIGCFNGTTTVTVSATGGTPTYSGTGTFTVHAGAYSYTVTDANGCTSTVSGSISQPTALVASAVAGTIGCFGGTTTVTVTATGGTTPYSGTGAFTVSTGAYSYTVTDAHGCTSLVSGTISQPAVLAASETHTTTCLGTPDGSINLTVTGGSGGNTFAWTGPSGYTSTAKDPIGLAAGNYSVVVTDANSCTTTLGPVAIALRTYTITPTAGAGGSISAATAQTVDCGGTLAFTITPATCYTFTGLLVDGLPVAVSSPYTFANVHGPHTITASFTAIPVAAAVPGLAAVRTTTGNAGSDRTRITINYTAPGDGNAVEIWRAGFGNYPEYNDNPGAGSVPVKPTSYPPAGWTKTNVTASGQSDVPPTRDFWYYVAYTVNACGQGTVSAVMTGGTLDYYLGDVHNGLDDCTGDNIVGTSDITALGFNYGAHLADPDSRSCLDVGPTTSGSVDARPMTDNRIDFEDLVLFAINYETVSQPSTNARPAAATGSSTLTLSLGTMPAVGETFEAVLGFAGGGDVQGLSAQLAFDPAVVEYVGVTGGSLLAQQGGPAQVFTPEPGTVDAAVFGSGQTLAGTGELARMTFRVKSVGDPGIHLGSVRARDIANRPVSILTPVAVASQPLPTRMELAPSYPNPFNHATTVVFGMPKTGQVKLAVFDIQGRAVRHLMDGAMSAGWSRVSWDGRSDDGLALAPGAYVIRLASEGRVITKSVRLVR